MGVGSGLAGEQEMEPMQERLPAEGLMGVEIIAQQGVVACVVALGVSPKPAFGGVDFAVLLELSVLRGDEFRTQGHDMVVRRADDHRRDGAVEMRDLAAGVFDARTVGTAQVLRGEIPGGIDCDEAGVVHRAHLIQRAGLIERFEQIIKEPEEVLRSHRIEGLADLIVTGNPSHLKERAGVVTAAGLFHAGLVTQEGGALGEEHRKGRQGEVGHGILGVVAGTRVRDLCGDAAQAFEDLVEAARVVHADRNGGTGSKSTVTNV